jgi:mannose-6-phosphate isomerase-like protein (cupin superfamily)
MNEPTKWDEATCGPMSLESIHRLFQPESRCRVSWKTYPAGVAFDFWSAARRCYIISGACTIGVAGHSLTLSAGEFVEIPEGDYCFFVAGEAPIELVSVWELPESFWRTSQDASAAVEQIGYESRSQAQISPAPPKS